MVLTTLAVEAAVRPAMRRGVDVSKHEYATKELNLVYVFIRHALNTVENIARAPGRIRTRTALVKSQVCFRYTTDA